MFGVVVELCLPWNKTIKITTADFRSLVQTETPAYRARRSGGFVDDGTPAGSGEVPIDIEIEEELDCDDEEMFAAEDAEEVEPPPIKLLPRGIAQWEIRRHQLDAGTQEAQFRILNTPTEEIDVTRKKQLAKVTETIDEDFVAIVLAFDARRAGGGEDDASKESWRAALDRARSGGGLSVGDTDSAASSSCGDLMQDVSSRNTQDNSSRRPR